MISIKLQMILLVFALLGLGLIFNLIRKYKLELKYSLLWLLLGSIIVILALFPVITANISKIIGIETPVNTLFLVGIVLSLIISFSLTLTISKIWNNLKSISQELGIVKEELKTLIESLNTKKS